jgi:glycosyltransferase involved in cell wall biosynthesis
VIVPARGCAVTLPGVLEAAAAWAEERGESLRLIVIDDGSRAPLRAPARVGGCFVELIRHERNRGYGGAQKSGYAAALAEGADQVVMLHGDGQYDPADTLSLFDALPGGNTPAGALGSRFLRDPSVIPAWRRQGNRLLTQLANLRFGVRHSELHTGARAYTAAALRALPLKRFSDDYLFDQQLLVACFRRGIPLEERPVRVRYDSTVQSIPPGRALRYALGCLHVIARGP